MFLERGDIVQVGGVLCLRGLPGGEVSLRDGKVAAQRGQTGLFALQFRQIGADIMRDGVEHEQTAHRILR